MFETVLLNDNANILADEDAKIVQIKWHRLGTTEQYKKVLDNALRIAKEKGIDGCISNKSNIETPEFCVSDRTPLSNLTEALLHMNRLAVVLPVQVYSKDEFIRLVEVVPNMVGRIGYFDSEEEAAKWMMQ